jgi:outer membrane protein OmpA-like peptidoglycan-associated protein
MNEYDIEYNDFLTYTEEEAAIYPHDEIEVISESAYSAWENVYKEGCTSTNPKNCYVLCHKKYPAVTTTIYKPIDQEEGSPYLKTIGKKTLVSKGGLTVWVEIDCELTTFSVLPIYFAPKTTRLLTTDLSVINSELITLLEEQPGIRFEINVHTDSRGIDEANLQLSQGRAMAIIDYIATQGINPDRLIARGIGETRLKNRCSNNVVCSRLDHAVNERVEFRAVNESF